MKTRKILANMADTAAGLRHLLKAADPAGVQTVLDTCFRCRNDGVSEARLASWNSEHFGSSLSGAELEELRAAATWLVQSAVYSSRPVASLLPAGFHQALGALLGKIVSQNLASWQLAAAAGVVAPPKLVDFDWRVDTKTASNHLSRMAVPTVFVEMRLQDTPTEVGVVPAMRDVQFELSKESLATMLDGLGKIRDQLGSIK